MSRPWILTLLAFAVGPSAYGSERAYRLLLADQSIAVPLTSVPLKPVHPGVFAGVSLWKGGSRESGRFEHRLQLDAGYVHQGRIENAVVAIPTWQSTLWIRSVGVTLLGGVGYKHVLYSGDSFVKLGGVYTTGGRLGHPELTAQVGLGLAAKVTPDLALVAQYRGGLEGPYSPELAPVLPKTWVMVGVEVYR